MTFLQAVGYFFREACLNLVRSFRISLVATLTIALSLFLGGLFYAVGEGLSRMVEGWGKALRVVVFLRDGVDLADTGLVALEAKMRSAPWVAAVARVSSREATTRLEALYPSLGDVLAGMEGDPLPASIEASLAPERVVDETAFRAWLTELQQDPRVEAVEDDREFLERALGVVAIGRAFGTGLGLALLLGAVFTAASVIRLTAYLYLDEIAVMRLVGATEFYVRGPFYVEGLLQGMLGGGLAVGGLVLSFELVARNQALALWLPGLGRGVPSTPQLLALIGLGGGAGLLGAVLSLRREKLLSTADD